MERPSVGNWLIDQGPQFLEEATWRGFFGRFLFASVSNEFYYSLQDKGASVWIVQQGDAYVPVEAPVGKQRQRAVHPVTFETTGKFDVTWRGDNGISGLERDLGQRAQVLTRQLNQACVDVVVRAASQVFDTKGTDIEGGLAEVADLLEMKGWHADRLLVPRIYRNRFVELGLITSSAEPLGPAHIGITKTGMLAFAYEDPTNGNLYVFDSHAGLLLQKECLARYLEKAGPFCVGVQFRAELTPIIEDTAAVVALSGVQGAIAGRTSGTVPAYVFGVQYVSTQRITELRQQQSPSFDLTRLVALCEEINVCYANQCYIATAALLRTILNHVPPVFGKTDFKDWASQCTGSLGKSMRHLQQAIDIADRHLHVQIGSSTTLPLTTQVDYRSQLDVLLEEIVRQLK